MYWIEVLNESGIISGDKTRELYNELNEILSIIVTAINTTKLKN